MAVTAFSATTRTPKRKICNGINVIKRVPFEIVIVGVFHRFVRVFQRRKKEELRWAI